VSVKISRCSSRSKTVTIEANLHNPKEGSKSHTQLLLEGQLESANLVERQQQNEQISDDVWNLHAVVERHQIDTFAGFHRRCPSLVDGCTHVDAHEHDSSGPHDHDGDEDAGRELEVMIGKQAAVLVKNGQLGEEDTERVLDSASVLDLEDLDEIGRADFLDRATNAMLNDCTEGLEDGRREAVKELTQRAADVEANLEDLQFTNQQGVHVRSSPSTYIGNNDEPIIKVETDT